MVVPFRLNRVRQQHSVANAQDRFSSLENAFRIANRPATETDYLRKISGREVLADRLIRKPQGVRLCSSFESGLADMI